MRGNTTKRSTRMLLACATLATVALMTAGCSPQGQQRWSAFNWDCVAAGGSVHVFSVDVQCLQFPYGWPNNRILAIEPLSYFG